MFVSTYQKIKFKTIFKTWTKTTSASRKTAYLFFKLPFFIQVDKIRSS